MRGFRRTAAAAALGLLVACAPDGAEPGDEMDTAEVVAETDELPDVVRIEDPGLHPEGIEWDAAGDRFLVSSVTRGTVTEVSDDGTHSVFIEDPDIVSSIGIHIDGENDRLLVANSNLAVFQGGENHAMLGSYDLETGERIFMVDLGALLPGGRYFANDIATAPDGTAYVTNFQTPAIYRVSPDGEASILVQGEALEPGGINGIEYHPDGFLVAAQAAGGALIRVSLDGATVEQIELPEPLGIDGLTFTADGRLVAVGGAGEGDDSRNEAVLLASDDGWDTATIVSRWEAAPNATTAAVRGDAVYVVDARFDDMGGETPAPHFDLTRVPFE